ncbi:hypothetical protein, partial [Citrobacter freundii]|uniref:hypothetical protein n=1 Tax=Citrobacter freundii TaxID=546 RepID=UPI003A97308F
LSDPQYRAADRQAAPAVLRPRRPAAHRCLADGGQRPAGAARPERAGKPAGAGHAVRAAGSEAGSCPGDYARPACPCLIRGAENPSGRH